VPVAKISRLLSFGFAQDRFYPVHRPAKKHWIKTLSREETDLGMTAKINVIAIPALFAGRSNLK
jgi:hypothetical protein